MTEEVQTELEIWNNLHRGLVIMGCCFGHSHIIHDPSIRAHARVGDMALVNGPMSVLYEHHCCRRAMLYVQGDSLYYYEAKPCQSLTRKFPFEYIMTTEVLRNGVVRVLGKDIPLNPGLQITMRGDNGLDTTLSGVMPDADRFANELKNSMDEFKDVQR